MPGRLWPESRVPARAAHRLRSGVALLRGAPLWVAQTRSAEFAALVRTTVQEWRPDVVQFETHVMGQYLGAVAGSNARTVLRQLEPGAAAARDLASRRRGLGRLTGALNAAMWRRFERDLLERMNAIVALTVRDATALRDRDPLAHAKPHRVGVVRIRLGVNLPERPANPTGRMPAELLFIGNFVHPPNVAAAERLAQRILPLIHSVLPETRLVVVGPRPPASLRGLNDERITVTGEVRDVRPFIDSAAVVVAPLQAGGGMRVKVAEALAAGKAVVASPLAIEGLEVTSGEQLVVAETDQELAEACLLLLRDPAERAALASRARIWAVQHLSWDRPVAAFGELYASIPGQG